MSNEGANEAGERFARQAARLVETARKNEEAVRDLAEVAQILAMGVDELASVGGLAQILSDVDVHVRQVSEVADRLREAVGAMSQLAPSVEALETAYAKIAREAPAVVDLAKRTETAREELADVDESLTRVSRQLAESDVQVLLRRIDALESKVDHIATLLQDGAPAYVDDETASEGAAAQFEM